MTRNTLKTTRELAGLSQSALDRKAGLDSGTVHDIESGRNANPTYTVVAKLVDAFRRSGLKGVTAESLFSIEKAS